MIPLLLTPAYFCSHASKVLPRRRNRSQRDHRNSSQESLPVTLIGGINDLDSITAVDGKFKFENLEPSPPTMKAKRVGYLEAPDTALTLQPGRAVKDLKLTPQAIIAGRVRDEDGDPILGARVAYIRWIAAEETFSSSKRIFRTSTAKADCTITGLSPGNYYLQVVPSSGQQAATRPGFRRDLLSERARSDGSRNAGERSGC